MSDKLKRQVSANEELGAVHVINPGVGLNQQLVSEFLKTTNANEISETLSSLLDTYLQHTDDNRLNMSNAANMVMKLTQLFYRLQCNENKAKSCSRN